MVLWFAAGTVRNSSSPTTDCSAALQMNNIYISYDDYLGFAGILVMLLIFGIVIAVISGLGLSVDSLPNAAKIIAAACAIFPVCVLLFFLVWLGLGTAMEVFCLNVSALFYIGLMWIYFLIVIVVGIVASLLIARSAKRAVQKALH